MLETPQVTTGLGRYQTVMGCPSLVGAISGWTTAHSQTAMMDSLMPSMAPLPSLSQTIT